MASLFGAPVSATSPASSGGSIFGAGAAGSGGSLFGVSAGTPAFSASGAASSSSSGATATVTAFGASGGASALAGSLFGGAPGGSSGSSAPVAFGGSGSGSAPSASLFGTAASAATSSAASAGSLFGAASASASSGSAGNACTTGAAATSNPNAQAAGSSLFGGGGGGTQAGSSLFGAATLGAASSAPAHAAPVVKKTPLKPLEECRQSARNWRRWLERGGGENTAAEADAVFTDVELCKRLSAPLERFDPPAPGSSGTPTAELPPRAAELAQKAAAELGVSTAVAESLVQLYADDRLSSFSNLHCAGTVYDLLDLSANAMPELKRLLHSERCQSLQVLGCILRGAHDDDMALSAQCRELAQRLLSEGLDDYLWRTFETKVSSLPELEDGWPSHADVQAKMNESFDLQIGLLECIALAHYDPELHEVSPFTSSSMAETFFRQRFLGSLKTAAHAYPWLMSDSALCERAQCVGDLSLAVFLESLNIEDVVGERFATHGIDRHPLLSSPEHVQYIHKIISSQWVDLCERAAGPRGVHLSPADKHCAQMVSVGLLGWAALLSLAPEDYCDQHDLDMDRISNCSILKSRYFIEEAVSGILGRGFLMQDAPNREHSVIRSVMRSFAAAFGVSWRFNQVSLGIHFGISQLMRAAFAGETTAIKTFWTADYPERRKWFFVLCAWLENFPNDMGELLNLISGLVGVDTEDAASTKYAVELLCMPLQRIALPYEILRSLVAVVGQEVVLQREVCLEEVILLWYGLPLPPGHVSKSSMLPAGAKGVLFTSDVAPDTGDTSAGRTHWIHWDAQGTAMSMWRIALVVWDALLEGFGYDGTTLRPQFAHHSDCVQLFAGVLKCTCALLIANPHGSHARLCQVLPDGERANGEGLISRLLLSFVICAQLPEGRSLLQPILRALTACCTEPPPPVEGQSKEAMGAEPSNGFGVEDTCTSFCAAIPILHGLQGGCAFTSSRVHVPSARTLVAIFNAVLDYERELNAYTITLAALQFIEGLLQACSPELYALPGLSQSHLNSVDSTLSFSEHAQRREVMDQQNLCLAHAQNAETLGLLLDFAFGRCFARCLFWPCRSKSDQWLVSSTCIRIALALLPLLECFNWPPSPELRALEDADVDAEAGMDANTSQLAHCLRNLRALQLCVLRSWSESSFVPTLMQYIACDIVSGQAGGAGSGQFIGFRGLPLEDGAGTLLGIPDVAGSTISLPIVTGAHLVALALKCFRGLLGLLIRPAGFAPIYAPLLHHILEVTAAREASSTRPSDISKAGPPHVAPSRADLVPSIYAHIRADSSEVSEEAAMVLSSVCALWCRADLRLGPAMTRTKQVTAAGAPRRAWLLACLSVPAPVTQTIPSASVSAAAPAAATASTKPASLSPHLARHILEVIPDLAKNLSLRCSFVELARASLSMKPALFLDDKAEFLPKAVEVCGKVLAQMLAAAAPDPQGTIRGNAVYSRAFPQLMSTYCVDSVSSVRLLMSTLGLLEDLVVVDTRLVLHETFSRSVELGDGLRSGSAVPNFPTMWHLLSQLVTDVLLPWESTGKRPWATENSQPDVVAKEPFLLVGILLRIASRGFESGDAIGKRGEVEQSAMLEMVAQLLGPGFEMCMPAEHACGSAASSASPDYDMMRRPFGPPAGIGRDSVQHGSLAIFSRCREVSARVRGLFSKFRLRPQLLDPCGSGASPTSCYTFGSAFFAHHCGKAHHARKLKRALEDQPQRKKFKPCRNYQGLEFCDDCDPPTLKGKDIRRPQPCGVSLLNAANVNAGVLRPMPEVQNFGNRVTPPLYKFHPLHILAARRMVSNLGLPMDATTTLMAKTVARDIGED